VIRFLESNGLLDVGLILPDDLLWGDDRFSFHVLDFPIRLIARSLVTQ
jgi:hypothetical protein